MGKNILLIAAAMFIILSIGGLDLIAIQSISYLLNTSSNIKVLSGVVFILIAVTVNLFAILGVINIVKELKD